MSNQSNHFWNIKEYRDMDDLWHRMSRSDQKVWIDFMNCLLVEWNLGENLNFFVGMITGACLFAFVMWLAGGA